MALSPKEKKELLKQRKENAKQAQKFHREQEKRAKKSSSKSKKPKDGASGKGSSSKIQEAVNSGKTAKFEKISREEKFRRESEEKIRNLKPRDFEDGYYIDEYSEKKRRERRAKIIRKQETETIRRNKKPLTSKQVRIRRILITAAILVMVIAIGVILSFTVLFKTEKIAVEGCSYYYDDQIVSYSNVSLQQNIFIAKMNSTPEEIVKNFAYVEDARVNFSIPDTIVITITDAVPAYYMTEGNNFLLVSAKGRVLERTDQKPGELPELICGEVSGTEVGSYIKFDDPAVPELLGSVAKSLADNQFTGVVGFDVTNTTEITIDYEGRIKINLGFSEDLDYKLRTAQAIIDKKLDPNHTGEIYGTLDVSTCAKNKISRYVPAASVPQTTQQGSVPATTAPENNGGGTTNSYDWNGDTNSWDGGDYINDWGGGYDWSGDTYNGSGGYDWSGGSNYWNGYSDNSINGGGVQDYGYNAEVPQF